MAVMHRRSKAAALLTGAATRLLIGATSPQSSFDAQVLAAHNRERASMGIAPLRWNAALAKSAQAWAAHHAATGSFQHAPDAARDPQGENLWAGPKGYYLPEAQVDAWIREKRYFRPGPFPQNSTTGRIEDVGHYTQLIWRDTQEVGCARATGRQEDVLVCRYSSAGNYIGEKVF